MDPAWFYSSLAQVAAAIVGLIGAILGSRLVEHLHTMRSRRSELVSEIRRFLMDVAITRQGWLDGGVSLRRELAEIESELAMELGKMKGPQSGIHHQLSLKRVEELETRKSSYEKRLRSTQDALEALPRQKGELTTVDLAKSRERLDALPDDYPQKSEAQRIARMLLKLEKEIGRFMDGLLPRSFYLVFVLLAYIAATGIVLPLAALPGYTHTLIFSKPILLIAFILGLVGLVGYFIHVLKEVHDLGKLTWN